MGHARYWGGAVAVAAIGWAPPVMAQADARQTQSERAQAHEGTRDPNDIVVTALRTATIDLGGSAQLADPRTSGVRAGFKF
jgi:hypothetical protein